jgi:Response regulator
MSNSAAWWPRRSSDSKTTVNAKTAPAEHGSCSADSPPRESQVLERIVAGRLNKQIADDLEISIKTVEAHRANIMDKIEARTMADLMKIALQAKTP